MSKKKKDLGDIFVEERNDNKGVLFRDKYSNHIIADKLDLDIDMFQKKKRKK
jgi:hypothetical protein